MPQIFVETPNLEAETFNLTDLSPFAELHGERLPHFTKRPVTLLFEEQAARNPNAAAIICADDRLNFAELNARANQLARHLRGLGVGRESLVGLCIDRSLDMAVGILAILKAGAAYLPLDLEYPKERLAFMLADAQPRVVLTKAVFETELFQQLHGKDVSPIPPPAREGIKPVIVLVDQAWPAISENSNANLEVRSSAGDLAYVIYTSGSTGKPKGAMITHGNLANYLLALNHELQIDRSDLYLHTASIAFSSARRQMLLPLSQGAAVVIATSEQRKDPIALFQMIKSRGVTVMDAVPSFWRNCTAILSDLPEVERRALLDNRLRLMLSASEPLLADIPRAWMNQFSHPARHVHMFGQTETAGIVSLFHVPRDFDDESYVPIGGPIANTDIYVLNEDKQPCAIDEAGELYIGGAGVGRGYLNRPELTAEKFIERDGERLYRTGDWARVRANGRIEFAGRRDQQVKLRGFRVELGEVEAAISSHPEIRESVVIARDQGNGGSPTRGPQTGSPAGVGAVNQGVSTTHDAEKRLIAYFVANGAPLKVSDLRSFLLRHLPDYLLPSSFVQMDALPLSANGKVDRLALPDPDMARPELSTDYLAPQTATEKRLSEIWSEVLRIESVGINDNFFELGGHSLLATQVVARVRREFKIQMPLRVLFEHPTVAEMAERVATANATDQRPELRQITPAERNGSAPLSLMQQSFWFLDQLEPDSSAYNIRTAIRITGALAIERLRQALEAIVARHEILRTNFVSRDDHPVQIIDPVVDLPFELLDLSALSPCDREAEVQKLSRAEGRKPFNLAQGPLLRAKLFRLGVDEHLLLLTVHHIVMDGWSIGVLRRELAALYQSFCEGRQSSLPSLPIQFADFAAWQRRWLEEQEFADQLEYWKQKLAGAPAALNLPTTHPRPAVTSGDGAEASLLLPAKLGEAIKALSQQEDATMFMTLLAAFQTLLFRYSGQSDVLIGTPIAGRTMVEVEDLIGPFINTLVFRTDASDNPTFRELLAMVRETSLQAYAHQDVPFEKLVEELRPPRSPNRTPLFQVMFALQNLPAPEMAADGLVFSPLKLSSTTAKFDLTLGVVKEANGLRAAFEYSTDLFAPATIERMLGHFQTLLETIVADPDQRLAELLDEELPPLANIAEFELDDRAPIDYQAPRTPIEERLTEIWREVLRLDRIGVNDNFFELGGHSLLATQVVSRVRRAFEIDLPLRSFFKTSTIAGLANAIYQTQAEQTEVAEFEALLAELNQLSDAEAEQQFAQEAGV